MPSKDTHDMEKVTEEERELEPEDNLPATVKDIKLDIRIPEVQHFDPSTPPVVVIADNAKYATFQMQVVSQLWDYATTFIRVTKLMKEQREVLRFRGDNLGIPYGSKSADNKGNQLDPID